MGSTYDGALTLGSTTYTGTSGGFISTDHTHYFAPPITYSPDYLRDWPWEDRKIRRVPELTKEVTVKKEIQDVVSKRRAKRIETIVDEVEAFMSGVPHDDGIAIAWRTKFKTSDKQYHYVAVQAEGQWYITNTVGARSRDEIVELLTEHRLDGVVSGPLWAPSVMVTA